VTGGESLIAYFESVAAAVGKPLIFTEIGYESATDAASSPAGSSTNVYDASLQSLLYQAFFDAWQQSGNASLTGVYFWNWDPNAAEVGPGNGANFSPQGEPALTEVTQAFSTSDKLELTPYFGPKSTLEIDITTSGSVVRVFDNISGGETVVDIPGIQISDAQIVTGQTDTPYVLDLEAGAIADALTVSAGDVLSGAGALTGHSTVAGTVSRVTVEGELELLSGGVASHVTVTGAGDDVRVDSGASATGTVLTSSGGAVVSGSATRTTVGGASDEIVYGGGVATSTTVLSGGTLDLLSGAVGDAITVSAGGKLIGSGLLAGASYVRGEAIGVEIGSGAAERVQASGTTTGTAVGDGGYQLVSSGGVAGGTEVLSGGRQYIYSDGLASATLVSAGGCQKVSSGGVASGATVLSGGRQYVYSGGETWASTVSSGGAETVFATGSAIGATVSNGGEEVVSSGGLASATAIQSGGRLVVYAGGEASGLAELSGGLVVDDGEVRNSGAGSLDGKLEGSGAVVETGVGDLVLSGAGTEFGGAAVISGGTLELARAGALGTGSVTFVAPATGSAVLLIDAADAPAAGGTFANTISNFNGADEDIDLRSIAFVSGASAKIVGSTLVLTDGGKTYSFKIAGGVAGAYPVLSDGHGGTLIDPTAIASQPNRPTAVEPQPLVPKVIAFAQAAAALAPSGAANTAPVSATSPAGQTPFAHATASAGAGRF
jgi:autotransporter passenger strand-loop-strand repeat protein